MPGRRCNHLQTLRARFLLALALIGILPMGLFGLGMATLDRRALAEQSARELTGLARGLAAQIGVYLDDLLSATRAIAALSEIVSLDPARQEPLLKELFHHYPQFARLSTFDLLGSRLASSHPGGAPSIAMRQSFQTAARRGHQAWEAAMALSSGRASLLIHTPIRDAERRVVGVVGAVSDLANLSAVAQGVLGGGGRVLVLDADERVLMHPEWAEVQERRDYSWMGISTGGRPAGPTTVRYQVGGEAFVAGYAPVPTTNWTVVVERPEQVILAPAQRSWDLAIAGLGTSIGLALLSAFALARMLTRPVQVLATAAQALAAGDATLPMAANASQVSEIRALVEAFAVMREAVRQREETLRQSEAAAQQRRQESEVLADLARTLNTSLDIDTVLLRVADGAKTLCQADIASLALRDPHSGAMILRYWDGRRTPESKAFVIEVGQGVGGMVLLTGRPFRTADYAVDPRLTHDYIAIMQWRGTAALMAAPISTGDRVEGLLYVGHQTARPFTDRDETILLQLADHAAIAIQNARLYAETEQRRKTAEGLAEVQRLLSQSLHPAEVSQRIVDSACVLLQALAAVLYRLEPASGELITVSTAGDVSLSIPGRPLLPHGTGVLLLAVRARQPVATANLLTDPRVLLTPEARATLEQSPVRAVLGVPLIVQDHVVGALGVSDRLGRVFTDEEIHCLQAFADQAATVLENARLFQETQQAYQELARTQDQLLQAQKMEAVGRLAGGVAHDFNNLLTVILGRAHLLLARLQPGEPMRRDVTLIQATANRAAALTGQLLAFSRKQVLQPSVLDLNTLVTDMHTLLQRLLNEDITLRTILDPALGRVKADRGQLDQVLLNLVVNARDAMPQCGQLTLETANVFLPSAAVRDHSDIPPGAYVRLAVRDTGTGMDAETQAHLFEPFFTTKGPGKGTGLGLATVHGIVTQSGGHITVDSVPGHGSTFTIYLPRLDEVADTGEPEAVQEGPHWGTETMVLVEDDPEVRGMTQEILHQHGYTVLVAANGHEALQHAAQHDGPIHLLLTDVVMPEMSGRELAERLAHIRPGIRVLYMSGYTDDALSRHGVLDPGTALLPKPFTPHGLIQKVREVLYTASTSSP